MIFQHRFWEEMGIAEKCKLITMPFPPRVFARPSFEDQIPLPRSESI